MNLSAKSETNRVGAIHWASKGGFTMGKTAITAWALVMATVVPWCLQAKTWRVPGDFETIQQAIDHDGLADGDEIIVGPGYFAGARITKSVVLKGMESTYIINGPKPWPNRPFNGGFLFRGAKAENGSGSKISNFIFQDIDFPIFASQAGVVISDVSVTQCTMENSIQGITMWHADNWVVRENRIIDLEAVNGGAIGILVGSYSADDALENIIENNVITGTVYVDPDDGGGYNAVGINLVSDYRNNRTGGYVEGNWVKRNKVNLVSDNPEVIPVVAFELTDHTALGRATTVVQNKVIENDPGQTETPVQLIGSRLAEENTVQF